MDISLIIQASLPVIVSVLGAFIHKAVKTPNDAQRAVSLSKIAEGFAALAVQQNPGATWAQLVQQVVDQLKVAPNDVTSSNYSVNYRAAAAAVTAVMKTTAYDQPKPPFTR